MSAIDEMEKQCYGFHPVRLMHEKYNELRANKPLPTAQDLARAISDTFEAENREMNYEAWLPACREFVEPF